MAPHTARFCGLEADARAELDFAARRGDFGDAAEAGGVYEAVGRSVVGVIEGVEEFAAHFEARLLSARLNSRTMPRSMVCSPGP